VLELLALMRFTPFSIFWTIRNVRPSASPSFPGSSQHQSPHANTAAHMLVDKVHFFGLHRSSLGRSNIELTLERGVASRIWLEMRFIAGPE
jgi:hypothetical protein